LQRFWKRKTNPRRIQMIYGSDEHGVWLEPERSDGEPRAYKPHEAKSLERLAQELGYKDADDLRSHSHSGSELLGDPFQRLQKPTRNSNK
jgi:hypothetical protein